MPIRTRQRWMRMMKRMRKMERVSVSLPLVGDCVELQQKVRGAVSSAAAHRRKRVTSAARFENPS